MESESVLSKALIFAVVLLVIFLLWSSFFSIYSPITVSPVQAAFCAKFSYESCLNAVPEDDSIKCVPVDRYGNSASQSSFARCSAVFAEGKEPLGLGDYQFLISFMLIVLNVVTFASLAWVRRDFLKEKLIAIADLGAKKTLKALAIPLVLMVMVRLFLYLWNFFTESMLSLETVSVDTLNSVWQADFAVGIGIALVSVSMYISSGFNMARAVQAERPSARFENAFAGLIGGIILVLLVDCIVFITNVATGLPLLEYLVIASYTSIAFPLVMALFGGFIFPKPVLSESQKKDLEMPEGY